MIEQSTGEHLFGETRAKDADLMPISLRASALRSGNNGFLTGFQCQGIRDIIHYGGS